MITYNSDSKIFTSSLINDSSFISGFSTRELMDGNKVGNIINFLKENEILHKSLICLGQIHSTNIEFVSNDNNQVLKIDDTDGVITDRPEIVLSVKTADCLPIIYVDKKNRLIGISHQGWRGSLKQMAVKMVNQMVEHGGNKKEIKIVIGPGINQCCYNIDDDRYFQFLNELDGYSEKVFSVRHGKKYLNLTFLNYLQLINTGIKKENIDFFPFCTFCDKRRFFSFRRAKNKDFEEMFSFVIRYN